MSNEITHRRICWPTPDATCLHGGCSYCNSSPFRSIEEIERYARTAGMLYHRGGSQQDAWEAYVYGLRNDFFNARVRRADGKEYHAGKPLVRPE